MDAAVLAPDLAENGPEIPELALAVEESDEEMPGMNMSMRTKMVIQVPMLPLALGHMPTLW